MDSTGTKTNINELLPPADESYDQLDCLIDQNII